MTESEFEQCLEQHQIELKTRFNLIDSLFSGADLRQVNLSNRVLVAIMFMATIFLLERESEEQ